MALSEDQKAMLRLLAQREQGYDDIAALMGIGVEDVRAKVREALADLDAGPSQDQRAMLRLLAQREEGYDDIAALTGSGVEDVRRKVRGAVAELDGPSAGESPKEPVKEPAPPPPPPAEPPKAAPAPPAEPPGKAATPSAGSAPKPPARKAPKPALPADAGAKRALIAGGAVVVVIVLLLVTGVLGGGDDGGSADTTTATTGAEGALEGEGTGTTASSGKQPTQALLKPVDGSDASGQALFGREGQKVVLLLAAKGLEPAPQGQSYTVSLKRSADERLPLVAAKATKGGVVSGRFQVAPQVLGLLAGGFDTMELSLVPDADLKAALAQARTAKKAPDYGGTTILEGPVTGPIVEAGEEG